jgi:hypothetical protein
MPIATTTKIVKMIGAKPECVGATDAKIMKQAMPPPTIDIIRTRRLLNFSRMVITSNPDYAAFRSLVLFG